MWIVQVQLPPSGMVPLTSLVLTAVKSGAMTVSLADAVPPLPPSSEVTGSVTLLFSPILVPRPYTLKVPCTNAPKVAPARVIEDAPSVAVIVPPPQVPLTPLGVATTSPVGRLSTKPTSVRVVPVFGFLTLKVNEAVPTLRSTVVLLKFFWIRGGATTVNLTIPGVRLSFGSGKPLLVPLSRGVYLKLAMPKKLLLGVNSTFVPWMITVPPTGLLTELMVSVCPLSLAGPGESLAVRSANGIVLVPEFMITSESASLVATGGSLTEI